MASGFSKKSMDELDRLDKADARQAQKFPIVLVLENVRSLYNVGSIFRSCDAFGVSELILCGISGRPPHREIQKTALGATETVPWQYMQGIEEALAYLRSKNFRIIGVEQVHGSEPLIDFRGKAKEAIALVLGNEVDGLSAECLRLCDSCIEIPQYGSKHSLNVSVTAGVVLWHLLLTSDWPAKL